MVELEEEEEEEQEQEEWHPTSLTQKVEPREESSTPPWSRLELLYMSNERHDELLRLLVFHNSVTKTKSFSSFFFAF